MLLKKHSIPFKETGYFSSFIADYLDKDQFLKPFYNRFPQLEEFEAQVQEKANHPINRDVLVEVLQKQYSQILNPTISTEASLVNIQKLSNSSTYTVTTGHQLSLFTGPLYFIYKIVSTINLAKTLQDKYKSYDFVPVFWMASEDHDFEEVNHINLFGGRVTWNSNQTGAVGRFSTEGIAGVIAELKSVLGKQYRSDELIGLLERAYTKHSNYADATRYIVHELFGANGLVIIDADDVKLKEAFMPVVKDELFNQTSYTKVTKTTTAFTEKYKEQVSPREINLFYLTDEVRERIIFEKEQYRVVGTSISFTKENLEKEIDAHPERFSPNVILRPLYQEMILPNIAYIGGGAEVAYWCQLKGVFDYFEVPFPFIMARDSVLWINKSQEQKLEKLGVTNSIFLKEEELVKHYVASNSNEKLEFDEYHQMLGAMFSEMEKIAERTDKSFVGAVKAQQTKQTKGLKNLEKRLLKAEKRRLGEEVERVRAIKHELFPNSSLQERYNNLIPFYLEYGEEFINSLLKNLNPLELKFTVLTEE